MWRRDGTCRQPLTRTLSSTRDSLLSSDNKEVGWIWWIQSVWHHFLTFYRYGTALTAGELLVPWSLHTSHSWKSSVAKQRVAVDVCTVVVCPDYLLVVFEPPTLVCVQSPLATLGRNCSAGHPEVWKWFRSIMKDTWLSKDGNSTIPSTFQPLSSTRRKQERNNAYIYC